jgi:hypothetical protein
MTEVHTEFFILNEEQFNELYPEAEELNVTLDYYLFEFCMTEGSIVHYDGDEWVEVTD